MTQLLHPALLARLVTSLAAGVGLVMAARVALGVLRSFDPAGHGEAQLALERRAELAATLVQAALVASMLGLALTVAAADRLSDSVHGAMCAYGVLASTNNGFAAVGTSAIVAVACGLWLVLHRLDLGTQRPLLTRRKFAWLLGLVPLVLADAALTFDFARSVDLEVVASCCASQLDGGGPDVQGASGAFMNIGGTTLGFGLSLAAISVAGLLGASARDVRSGRWRTQALAAGGMAIVATGLALPTIVAFVAPHAYESPQHRCPFCLLHADVLGVGWFLYGALLVALTASLGLAFVAAQTAGEAPVADAAETPTKTYSGAADLLDAAAPLSRALARAAWLGWLVTALLMLAPVLRYVALTGGLLW